MTDPVTHHDDRESFWHPRLETGERRVWAGIPPQNRFLIRFPQHIYIPFGIAMMGGMLWGLTGEKAGAGLIAAVLVAAIPGLVAWWLAWGHLLSDRNRRQATRYALTDRAALIAVSDRVDRMPLDPELEIEATLSRDPGHVRFGPVIDWPTTDPVSVTGYAGANAVLHILPSYFRQPFWFQEIPAPRAVRDLARSLCAGERQ